jgi:capsular polysaccharide biosynthesis protein
MRAAGTDAVGALRWGLRRYRLLFLACLLIGAVLAPVWAVKRDTPADATTLVIAQRLDMSLDSLPRYGEAVFTNGQVAQAIAAKFGDAVPLKDVVPDRVSLVAEQDSIVFQVVGHDADRQTAADIANTAADTFIQGLNAPGAGVGVFALQTPAERPGAPGTRIGVLLAVPMGIGAGLVLGLAAVSALLVARRPVIEAADAEEAAGVTALGSVTVPRRRRGMMGRPEDIPGLLPACRRLLGLPRPTVVLVSRPRDERVRRQLSVALASVLMHVRDLRFIGPSELQAMGGDQEAAAARPVDLENGARGRTPARLTLVDSSDPLDLMQPPESTVTVLVVPEGINSGALRAAVVEHLGGSAEARLLLVKRGPRLRGRPVVGAGEDVRQPEAVAMADRA